MKNEDEIEVRLLKEAYDLANNAYIDMQYKHDEVTLAYEMMLEEYRKSYVKMKMARNRLKLKTKGVV